MEYLAEIVRNVVLIVLLSAFLQMLIPRESMGRYVDFVMGLFVLIAILNPLLPFLTGEEKVEINAWQFSPSSQSVSTILENGRMFQLKNQQLAFEQYKSNIEAQVISVAGLVGGVGRAEAEVLLKEDAKSLDFGAIDEMALLIYSKDKSKEESEIMIESIQLDYQEREKFFTDNEKEKISQEIKQGLTTLYSLTEEQINIIFVEE